MKTVVALFLCSAAFGLAIAVTYWCVAHQEATGTVLLGVTAAALVFAASYAAIAERHADLDGDRATMTNEESAGEDLGVFTKSSAWPILIAAAAAVGLCGIPWSPLLAAAGFAALILCLWRMGAESARV